MSRVYDGRACALGEGPLWHPELGQLFWFDILGKRLLSRAGDTPLDWRFDEMFSAAGWVDRDRLLVASETALWVMDLASGALDQVTALDADNPLTRSNDGRADPYGGFWIGTMGKQAETGLGSIWRYYRGELRRLFPDITIPNAICFSPDRHHAYFADTRKATVWRVGLETFDGWPKGSPEIFLDLSHEKRSPDGAVTDAAGNLWLAEWGASRVACYGPDGVFQRAVPVGGRHSSCPAFGGAEFSTLFVTTARQGLSPEVLAAEPLNGCVFTAESGSRGLPEYRVIL